MQSLDNKDLAYCNAVEITKTAADCGFVPNFTAPGGFKTYDRSQPPVGSMVCLMIYKRYQEKWFLEEVYPNLLSWNRWMFENRTVKDGLLAWGSNPYESKSDHKFQATGINEKQGAAWESGLDDSPMYDGVPFDPDRHIMLLEDIGLTGLYLNDCYRLAEIAEILGDLPAGRPCWNGLRQSRTGWKRSGMKKQGSTSTAGRTPTNYSTGFPPFTFMHSSAAGWKSSARSGLFENTSATRRNSGRRIFCPLSHAVTQPIRIRFISGDGLCRR